jgi:hypothetical protein
MEYVEDWFPVPLPEVTTISTVLNTIDLSQWDLSSYYEAIGLDFEEDGE